MSVEMRLLAVARAIACSVAGPAGYFLFPAVVVASETATSLMGHDHPLAQSIAAVSTHVLGHLTSERVRDILSTLDDHSSTVDLGKVMLEAMRFALQTSEDALLRE